MQKVKPYTKINEALLSLDNGGRFYNLFTKAKDGVISQAELGKIGGIFNDKQKMILFLELSLSKLTATEKEIILKKLDEKLKIDYLKYKPQNLLPSEVIEKSVLSSNIILTGIPKLIDSKSDFKGFIMIPIMTGKVMTFSMIPIIENYDVYELKNEESSETFIIAHSKSSDKLPNKKIVIAGVLKELEKDKNGNKKTFLEAIYLIEDK
ncbi:hypothetical protein [Polaribacter sp. Asnod1-A03]|uniref:hypothetical protein n=1 Tax=Polaribacter sp. Asnod1-A03 TaxID=3160581 RepID=UPI003866605D